MKKSLFLFSILLAFLFGRAVLAAEPKDAKAQQVLGIRYTYGLGVPMDFDLAVKWLSLSAKQGYALAQYNLGVTYANGEGVLQDNIRSHMWFNIAASNNHIHASGVRDEVAKRMSSADIVKAEKLARKCLKSNYKAC